MRLTADVAFEHGRPVRIFGTKQDITYEKELWERLRQLAECDPLTGLANRGVFEERLPQTQQERL
jgi:GGDEF domain-containing protein